MTVRKILEFAYAAAIAGDWLFFRVRMRKFEAISKRNASET